MSVATEGEYKGNPTLTLQKDAEDKYPFSFGVKKAQLIMENLEAIGAFVDKHSKPEESADGK